MEKDKSHLFQPVVAAGNCGRTGSLGMEQPAVAAGEHGSGSSHEPEQATAMDVKRLRVSLAFLFALIAEVVAVVAAYFHFENTAAVAELIFIIETWRVHDFWVESRFTGGNAKLCEPAKEDQR